MQERTEPFCAICKPFYKMVKGYCVPYNNDFAISLNCLAFGEEPVGGLLLCELCAPGFSMLKSG